jgi:glycine/D-amino acid oxidase-like deaminating enzyme
MSRVFEPRAYAVDSLTECFWAEDFPGPDFGWPVLLGDAKAEVAVIGAGYTGLSAALHLAQAGVDVAVLDMHGPGWGASGRSGGFVCLGGATASDRAIRRQVGAAGLADWQRAQRDAVALVADLLDRHGIDAQTHSQGETQLAHSPRQLRLLEAEANAAARAGEPVDFIAPNQMQARGMGISGLSGGLTTPHGFALHPRRYVLGLAEAYRRLGGRLFVGSEVIGVAETAMGLELRTTNGRLRCKRLIIATNGYGREDVPRWMAGRFLPVQSNILVTRPLSDAEIAAQGWSSAQMVYDTRVLLHYFRLLPDRRMMFGMRGGFRATPASDRKMQRIILRDFKAMFPAWAEVETPWFWSGLISLMGRGVPYAGPVPGLAGAYAGFGWHGNGIAMGSYAGAALARLALGQGPDVPEILQRPPVRIPFGTRRRLLLPPKYAQLGLRDWLA